MTSLIEVILVAFAGGVLSLIGGFILISRKETAVSLARYATPFAAGALLSAAFLDLLNEAGEIGSYQTGLYAALIGIVLFFFLEHSLDWFHHHHEHEERAHPTSSLIIIGDTLHNFIDGIAIGSAMLVDLQTGLIVAGVVALHEIPQEIGDFGLLLKKGMKSKNVIAVNFFSALATVIGAVLIWQLGQEIAIPMGTLLGLVAGFFIYIAASDIIPSIHEVKKHKLADKQAGLLLLGVLSVGLIITYAHNYLHAHQENSIEETEHLDHY